MEGQLVAKELLCLNFSIHSNTLKGIHNSNFESLLLFTKGIIPGHSGFYHIFIMKIKGIRNFI